jgi:hypothetical protein
MKNQQSGRFAGFWHGFMKRRFLLAEKRLLYRNVIVSRKRPFRYMD